MDGAGRLTKVLPDHDTQRRQTVEPSYRPNGAVYVASPAQARARGFWSPATRGFVMARRAFDGIDSAADLECRQGPFLASRPVPDIECGGGGWTGPPLLRDRGGRGKITRLAGAGVEAWTRGRLRCRRG